MSDWLTFEGKAVEKGGAMQLTTSDGEGIIELKKDDVKFEGGKITVRMGSVGKTIKEPSAKRPVDQKLSEAANRDCPGGKTKCVGLLLFCCSTGKLIGPCIGGWGCG
jgi:hypothetical protein